MGRRSISLTRRIRQIRSVQTGQSQRQKGIGLLELAMALLILGLLIMMFQDVIKLFFDVDHRLEQLEKTRILKGSIETYLTVNSRLPCPDTDGDGREDITSNVCDADHGGGAI